jgi:hypothetical protein
MSQHDETVPESSYPSLIAPEFTSQIPEYLLKDASDQDKHILAQLSVMAQISEWSVKAHISTMESVRKTNGRLIRAEEDIKALQEDKKFLKRGWKTVVAVAGVLAGVIAFLIQVWQVLGY